MSFSSIHLTGYDLISDAADAKWKKRRKGRRKERGKGKEPNWRIVVTNWRNYSSQFNEEESHDARQFPRRFPNRTCWVDIYIFVRIGLCCC